MKKFVTTTLLALLAGVLFSGCVAAIGNRDAQRPGATLGQQLIDLQKAKEAGAISDTEYQAQKAKLLGEK